MTLAWQRFDDVLADAGQCAGDIVCIATAGEGEKVKLATRHIHSMTTRTRGGTFLDPAARALDGRGLAASARPAAIQEERGNENATQPEMVNEMVKVQARAHPDFMAAGAIGAALWGAFRPSRLNQMEAVASV